MQEKMTQYQNALADMSNEAVEYVRGIPVVKTFGQTVYSFKKFKGAIDRYSKWAIAYTKELRTPMMFYTLAINGVFVFLIAAGLLFTQNGVSNEFLLNLIFILSSRRSFPLTLTKLMFMSENEMIVNDAFERIDAVLDMPPLSGEQAPGSSQGCFRRAFAMRPSAMMEKKTPLQDVSLSIGAGETVAFVGPSGGGKTTLASLIARFFDTDSGSVKVGARTFGRFRKTS